MKRGVLLATLARIGACDEALGWAASTKGTPAQLWEKCDNPEWMLWLLERVDAPDSLLRHLAADFAQEAAQYAGPDEEMAIAWCIDVARRRADGEVEPEEIDAAWAAASAAAWAAASAAAWAAASAAAWAAASDAAWTAARTAAWTAASAAQCDSIRARVPWRDVERWMERAS